MAQNAEDGGNRKWICVQLPEETADDSEAHKVGYKTIADISRERIKRAGAKINKGDVSFKSFKLSPSNYRQWNVITDKDDIEKLKQQMQLFVEKPLVDGADQKAVVYEVLLKEGLDLNVVVERGERGGVAYWRAAADGHQIVMTFASKLLREEIDALGLAKDDTFVCFDSALDDSLKLNTARDFSLKVI